MGEYASITAAVAALAVALGGLTAPSVGALPANDAKAIALVSAAARDQHVSVARARAAYRRAPYGRAGLRYLYTVGWLGSAAHPASCQVSQVFGSTPEQDAAAALAASPRLVARLRAAGVTVKAAAAVLGRGATAGCR